MRSFVFALVVLPIAQAVVEAVKHAQLTEDQFARELGVSPQQWHQQKNGIGHISLTRIADKTPEVMRWLSLVFLQGWGLPQRVEQAAPVIATVQTLDRRRSA